MKRLIPTSIRLSDPFIKDQDGQITVFLSLLFFLILGVCLLVFSGMREYNKSSLVEETFDLAGEDILANYDIPLYERYHLFLMDPREEAYLVTDGKSRVEESFQSAGFMTGIDCEITLDDSKKALDDDGKTILKQIKEWETVYGIRKIPNVLNQLLKSTEKEDTIEKAISAGESSIASADSAEDASDSADGKHGLSESSGSGASSSDMEESGEKNSDQEESEEEKRVKKTWKDWKKVLTTVFDSGILLYVVDDKSSISSLQLASTSELPSENRFSNRTSFSLDHMDLTGFSKLKDLCQEGISVDWDSSLLTSDVYLLPYIFDCFSHYRNLDQEYTHRLSYEIEYMVAGKKSDRANLKYVADQLFLLRFLTNYGYALGDSVITDEADVMATVLTGILRFPQAKDAVKALLVASLAYGESLLEVRALFQGQKVALVKSRESWNLSFATAPAKLLGSADIISVEQGVGYEQYLAMLLVIRSGSRKILYRMLDIMQSNITLEEPEFLMKECIYSFDWTGQFSWSPFVKKIAAFGLSNKENYAMKIRRTVNYE